MYNLDFLESWTCEVFSYSDIGLIGSKCLIFLARLLTNPIFIHKPKYVPYLQIYIRSMPFWFWHGAQMSGVQVLTVIKITMVCHQVCILYTTFYCSLSIKVNTRKMPLCFNICSRQKPKDPQIWAPWLMMPLHLRFTRSEISPVDLWLTHRFLLLSAPIFSYLFFICIFCPFGLW